MARTTPTTEPVQLTAGDSWAWDRSFSAFPAADGWSLTYHLRGAASLDIAAAVAGAGFEVRVPATSTSALPAGSYRLAGYASNGAERIEVYNAVLTVLPNFAAAGADAGLSHAERTLRIIEAAIEGRISSDMESYQVNGRAITKIATPELVRLRGHYASRVWRERNPGRLGATVEVSFGVAR